MLITILLFSVFVAPLTRAADDTYSVSGDKITIKSDIFKDGTYTDGDNDPEIKCQSGDTRASVAINQEDKDKIKNGEKLDSVAFSIEATDGDATGCPSGVRTAQVSGTTDSSQDEGSDEDDDESCKIEGFGWVICGPSMWIAKGMDTFYKSILEDFLVVKPLDSEGVSSILYKAWDIVRGFANAVFIIIFIIIIYSQLTSIGVSNYGVKKIAPRLVVVAVLVNLSYYICVIGVDLSNILGVAVKDIFNDILSTLMSDRGSFDIDTIEIVAKTLSGGTLAVAGITLAKGALLAAAPLILPTLLSLFLAVLVAVLIMSARQALIIILVIISPLAFVAYLLPGTDKLFGKWKDTFITMLVFFPAFSFVFGGANMAGAIISQSADGSVIRYLLGWIVQLAPLAITPLILKFSGGVLGKIAGMVNNPNKGIVDRSRKWAENKSKDIANKRTYANPNLKKGNFLRRRAQKSYWNNKNMEESLAKGDMDADNLRRSASGYGDFDRSKRESELDKSSIDKGLESSWNQHMIRDRGLANKDLSLRTTAEKSDALSKRADARYEDFRTGKDQVYTGDLAKLQQDAMRYQEDAFLTDQRMTMAKSDQSRRIAEAMKSDNATVTTDAGVTMRYQDYAGGVLGSSGAAAALANAIASRNKAYNEGVQEQMVIQEHFKLTGGEREALVRGESVKIDDVRGKYTFTANDETIINAAATKQMAIGTFEQKLEVAKRTNQFYIDETGKPAGTAFSIRADVSDNAAKSGIAKMAVYMGGRNLENIAQGTFTEKSAIQDTLIKGKVKDLDFSTNDFKAMENIFKQDDSGLSAEDAIKFNRNKQELKYSAWRIIHDPQLLSNTSTNSQDVLKQYMVEPPKN